MHCLLFYFTYFFNQILYNCSGTVGKILTYNADESQAKWKWFDAVNLTASFNSIFL